MNIAIVYDSKTGNTAKMAERIVEGIHMVNGCTARTFPIDQIDEEYIKNCKALIVGTPTYHGSLSSSLKAWMEQESEKLNLSGKLAGAFATAAVIHGGADLAIQCILTHLMVEGMLIYSGGRARGLPMIHLGPVALSSHLEDFFELFRIYGTRMAQQASALF